MNTDNYSSSEEKPLPPRGLIRERREIGDTLSALAESAKSEIVIFAPQLNSEFFNTARFSHALGNFAARHRNNTIRILVEDGEQAIRDNDRLVGLCRRLSDFIHMHRVSEEHIGIREMFVVVDHTGYLHQEDIGKPECIAHHQDHRHADILARRFNEIWDRSELITSLRTAGL